MLHDYQNHESCKEVTLLYRAANKLIKTMYIAHTAMIQGDDNKAILNYNEVASIFSEKKKGKLVDANTRVMDSYQNQNLAICYNNIACIHAKQKDYAKQNSYFEKSIHLANNMINNHLHATSKEKTHLQESLEETRFKLACRFYNYGYALYR